MIQLFLDHWEQAAAVVVAAFIVGAGWAVLKRDIRELKKSVGDNRAHMDAKFKEMKDSCATRLATCQGVHDGIQGAFDAHHDDTHAHLTDAERDLHEEWRSTVLQRFDRLEGLIIDSLRVKGHGRGTA